MEILIGIIAVAIAAYVLNIPVLLYLGLVTAAGGLASYLFRPYSKLDINQLPGTGTPKWWEWLIPLDGWGAIFRNIMDISIAIAAVGYFSEWSITGQALNVGLVFLVLTTICYLLCGLGKGIVLWQNQQIGDLLGIDQDFMIRLDRLTPDKKKVIEDVLNQPQSIHTDEQSQRASYREQTNEARRLLEMYESESSTDHSALANEGVQTTVGSGKEQISESEAVRWVIRGLLDDVEDSYPSYFEKIESGELLGQPMRVFPMNEDSKYHLALGFLSLEILTSRSLFDDDRANRILYLSIVEFANNMSRVPDDVFVDFRQLEEDFNIFCGKLSSDATGIADRVYMRMGIPLRQFPDRSQPAPDPLIRVALSTLLGSAVGRWKNMLNMFDLVKDEIQE